MIKKEYLRFRGYRNFAIGQTGVSLWQKWIVGRSQDGEWKGEQRLYAMDIYEYEFPTMINGSLVPERLHFEPKVRMYMSTGAQVDVGMLCCDETTIDSVEEFYMNVFWKLDCVPDRYNNIVMYQEQCNTSSEPGNI